MTQLLPKIPVFQKLLSDVAYERFQKLVLERTGMLFGVKRRNALGRGITLLCEKTAQNDLHRYFKMLKAAETDSPVWDALIEELTVGETYFFRDENQIKALKDHLLPRIIEAHKNDRRIRIWSAGCASGEEAYTLSILLTELISDMEHWNISILGTDINKKVLNKGKAARYRGWSFRQTDPVVQSRYFLKRGEAYEAISEIRRNVHFEYLNLNEPVYPSLFTNTSAMDLILCRNVAIYYSEEVVRRVVSRFYQCLLNGGWLMMGASETSIPVFDQYAYHVVVGGTVYRKSSELEKTPKRLHFTPVKSDMMPQPLVEPDARMSDPFFVAEEEAFRAPIKEVRSGAEKVAANPEETVPASHIREQAVALLRQKQYDQARELLLKAVDQNPGDAESLYHLGRVHANLGQVQSARSFCERSIETDPLRAEVHYTLALIYQESGENDSAMECLKRTLFLDPDFVLAHVSMAILCRQLNQEEKSERHRRQAVELAGAMIPETVLPGTDDLTARTLLTMARTL